MNVAIIGEGFIEWGGGIDFLKNFINALCCNKVVNIVLFIPKYTFEYRVKNLVKRILGRKVELISYKDMISGNRSGKAYNFISEFPDLQIVYYRDNNINDLLKVHNVDIAFPVFNSGLVKNNTPYIGYIYDFQHKYLEGFFDENEIKYRDKCFKKILTSNKFILANSLDVYKDIYKFYPQSKVKVYIPPFSPIPREEWLQDNSHLLEEYSLPSRFFLISNQFWLHKNHILTLYALQKLHNDFSLQDIHFVYTGKTVDPRDLNYFNTVKQKAKDLHVNEYVHFLGYIPKLAQIEIMKKSIAVIQPTTFEGGPGGGVAFDAISMGKKIILSDIPVNLEILNDNAIFFKNNSVESLVSKICELCNSNIEETDVSILKNNGDVRKQRLCDFLIGMFEDVIKDWDNYELS